MNNAQATLKQRRTFLKQSLLFALSFPVGSSMARLSKTPMQKNAEALPAALVFEFVRSAHVALAKVKEMLAKEPLLVNACWDWGGGDFELAIGGAAHMGNKDIATYLLEKGARIDIFCAAMLGEKEVVASLVKMSPNIVNINGPHKFPLLYHVAISGDVDMAALLKPHMLKERISPDCNRSLQAAARAGHVAMTEWLLSHGADDPNTKDVLGRTPLALAEANGHKKLVMLLKEHGAK